MQEDIKQYGYVKYKGKDFHGSVEIGKLAKTLYALDKFSKKYQRDILGLSKDEMFKMKASDVKDGSTEIWILIQTGMIATGILLDKIGITEYTKKYFSVLGEQAALKKLAKNKKLKEQSRKIEGQEVIIVVENSRNETKRITPDVWENYKKLHPLLNNIVDIEKGDEVEIGYADMNGKRHKITNITFEESKFFIPEKLDEIEGNMEDRLQEEFNEENSEEIKITGKFIDFFGMAQKYHCSFQARREQGKVGKQKILCILNSEEQKDKVLDLLKDRDSQNILYIFGRATRDWDDRVDKIKVDWINTDENYNPNPNPNQTKIEF